MKLTRAVRSVGKQIRQQSTVLSEVQQYTPIQNWNDALPYTDIPGPKPLPFIGNSWRFLPYFGKYLFNYFKIYF